MISEKEKLNMHYDFTQNKPSIKSLAFRKPVYGIGVNDANYIVQPTIDGKQIQCPYYQKWKSILMRCYSAACHEEHPTYADCSVAKEWLTFSNFRSWMVEQYWEGMELDKDIKFKNSKIYSKDTCLFIPKTLNTLLLDCKSARGKYPIGVYFHKPMDKFKAQISYSGIKVHLGYFSIVEEAAYAYKSARKNKIQQIIDNNTYPVATQYLAQHI